MRFVIFTHSLVSDWNHGNAHFLRGIALELVGRGCEVRIFEPEDGWSRQNLIQQHGAAAIAEFERAFPSLRSVDYELSSLNLDVALKDADVVLVHEWNDPVLIERIGHHRASRGRYRLFFHDTHHRSVTAPEQMAAYDLRHYDGVLAYGKAIRDLYLEQGWARNAWIWHEAADVRTFYPRKRRRFPPGKSKRGGDLVWIGNWGDEERAEELREFLIEPVRRAGLKACVYGVRYPDQALRELAAAGIEYRGWVANYRVPEVFAEFRVTVHIPRRPYAFALQGIPTIRPFEALACGIPLISAPWEDRENLFRPGRDFLFARDGEAMRELLTLVLADAGLAAGMARQGLETIRNRHTCAHRVDELLDIIRAVAGGAGLSLQRRLQPPSGPGLKPRLQAKPRSTKAYSTQRSDVESVV